MLLLLLQISLLDRLWLLQRYLVILLLNGNCPLHPLKRWIQRLQVSEERVNRWRSLDDRWLDCALLLLHRWWILESKLTSDWYSLLENGLRYLIQLALLVLHLLYLTLLLVVLHL